MGGMISVGIAVAIKCLKAHEFRINGWFPRVFLTPCPYLAWYVALRGAKLS
jgi:hypothetical protein